MGSAIMGWTALATLLVTFSSPSAVAANGCVVQIQRRLDAPEPGSAMPPDPAMDKYLPITRANKNDAAAIGQAIWLRAQVRVGQRDITNTSGAQCEWCFDPGGEFETTVGYQFFDLSRAEPWGPPPLDSYYLKFIWYGGTDKDSGTIQSIGLTVIFKGEWFYDLADITVLRPTGTLLSGTGDGPYISKDLVRHKFGIAAAAVTPRLEPLGTDLDGRGKLGLIQILKGVTRGRGYGIDPISQKTTRQGEWEVSSGGKKALDVEAKNKKVFMGDQTPGVLSGQRGANNFDDAPETPNPSYHNSGAKLVFNRIVEDNEFTVYLVYRPDGKNSIWVPLKSIRWDFKVTAEPTGGQWGGQNDRSTKGNVTGHDAATPLLRWEPDNWATILAERFKDLK